VCIVNFAAEQNDVILYTDLIKVGVALDDGEILSFDMRGYLTNHTIRDLPQAKISEEHAISLVSPNLDVLDASLCVIPSSGQNELFCYEVKCTGESGQNVLVYVNAVTGREEQILLLRIGNNGTLTV
ncbi:MAG: germination protein YpeB, partial [Ruminiclostridium sp.]|nr:germination protein YpeB [Ruminiclostridium sp.]